MGCNGGVHQFSTPSQKKQQIDKHANSKMHKQCMGMAAAAAKDPLVAAVASAKKDAEARIWR